MKIACSPGYSGKNNEIVGMLETFLKISYNKKTEVADVSLAGKGRNGVKYVTIIIKLYINQQ